MKTVVVVPHHLKTLEFLNEWKTEFASDDVHIIIVEDKPHRVSTLEDWMYHQKITIYTHADIDKELGKNSWIIPYGTSAIRSYGLYKAWQRKPDMIVTLDNDCFPDIKYNYPYYLSGHWRKLQEPATLDWVRSSSESWLELHSRGFPYLNRNKSKVYVNHGLWSNIPDLDAASMLLHPDLRTSPVHSNESIVIPRFNFYPMCGMNLAFRPEVTPLMYFGLFGEEYGFDQFDDIWAGVFSKKVMDHLSWAVRSGYPSVEHRKQSDAFTNFRKQAGGMSRNEILWQAVQNVKLTADNPIDCYKELAEGIITDDKYFIKMKKAMLIWLKLFNEK